MKNSKDNYKKDLEEIDKRIEEIDKLVKEADEFENVDFESFEYRTEKENAIYEKTKEFGRTQFVREIMRLERENKELHNKIDEISNFIKENKIKRYRPIEGEEYDEEIVLDEDDITCLERIINDEYDYENR